MDRHDPTASSPRLAPAPVPDRPRRRRPARRWGSRPCSSPERRRPSAASGAERRAVVTLSALAAVRRPGERRQRPGGGAGRIRRRRRTPAEGGMGLGAEIAAAEQGQAAGVRRDAEAGAVRKAVDGFAADHPEVAAIRVVDFEGIMLAASTVRRPTRAPRRRRGGWSATRSRSTTSARSCAPPSRATARAPRGRPARRETRLRAPAGRRARAGGAGGARRRGGGHGADGHPAPSRARAAFVWLPFARLLARRR